MNRKLSDLLGDTPDTDVRKSVIEATVTKRTDDLTFRIKDGQCESVLEVDKKFKDIIIPGYKFQFYSPEKLSSEKLRLTPKSYAKKLCFDQTVEDSIRLKDLIGMADSAIVKKNLVVKILDIYDQKLSRTGNQLR